MKTVHSHVYLQNRQKLKRLLQKYKRNAKMQSSRPVGRFSLLNILEIIKFYHFHVALKKIKSKECMEGDGGNF